MFPLVSLVESVSCKWLLLSFLLISWASSGLGAVDGVKGGKVRGVNLGNSLVIEGWMEPSLFNGIENQDMLDGAKVRFKSPRLNKYISAKNGGGSGHFVDQENAIDWETFRVTQSEYQLRAHNEQFLSFTGQGDSVSAKSVSPSKTERVRIKYSSGKYLQVRYSGSGI